MKRILVDQGSVVEVMYPDLYRGLNLRPEDLTSYNSLLVSFEGKIVTPMGQIKLPIQTGLGMVEVDFIVVDAYSPYTAIVARPWLHTLMVVSSTLHQKMTRRKARLRKLWGIRPWLDIAWWLPSRANPVPNLRPLPKRGYGNQPRWCCSVMNQLMR